VASGWWAAGEHTVTVDMGLFTPGVYLFALTTPGARETVRLAITR
jgi:hypothetical protein